MNKLFFFLSCLFVSVASAAAQGDSLMAIPGLSGWNLMHQIVPGERLAVLSERYHVPVSVLAYENSLPVNSQPLAGSTLLIPVGGYNLLSTETVAQDSARPFYYRVAKDDGLYQLNFYRGLPPAVLTEWKRQCITYRPPVGSVVQLGWVRYNFGALQVPPVEPGRMTVRMDTPRYLLAPPDTAVAVMNTEVLPPLQQLWNEQTGEGQNVVEEKVTAGFFPISDKAVGGAMYAFSNTIGRGMVIQVRNTNNNRSIYVKVLGTLPNTRQFAGSSLGLSSTAKAALGVRETKAFCAISYAGY